MAKFPTFFPIKNILIPYDESACSMRAFKSALEYANQFGSSLSVLTIKYSEIFASSFLDMPVHRTSVERTRLQKLNDEFNLLDNLASKLHVKIEHDIVFSSSVSESILSHASRHDIDLIVMGTRGRGNAPLHMRLGSIAIRISQSASCPVLLIK